jgi:hypothetical protein
LSEGSRVPGRRNRLVAAIVIVAAMVVPAAASAHLERPSYWPDPDSEMVGGVPAGGAVPEARSLASAVTGQGPGDVRVVCQQDSLRLAINSAKKANKRGFRLRPSLPRKKISDAAAKALIKANRHFAEECEFNSVQDAINASGNNDRVIVMPGIYREPKSRQAPTNDPRCNPELLQQDQTANQNGDPANTPSYEYQATCPNDQNLIYVQGREVVGDPLAAPRPDRHGIPEEELGPCIRCNLQIDGSGARPENVIMDAGSKYAGLAKKPGAQPGVNVDDCSADPETDVSPCYAKHVVLRTDRSDGFVGQNFTMRGALEHGFYTEETDGILLNKTKFFWAADYGHLSFTTDHNVIKNCDGFGSGDAVVYPGAAPQTGEFRNEAFYPDERYNTIVKRCDLHGSVLAYSGSMGNSVRVTQNNIYGNSNGISSDTLSAPGHPGYPADGMKIDNNLIYSNNLNMYTEDPRIKPLVPMPIGTAIVWPGMNDGEVSKNWIFDNWRHGALLASVPDAVAGEPDGNVDSQFHCEAALPNLSGSTSCDNEFFDNKMGQVPPGFTRHPALTRFGNETGIPAGRRGSAVTQLPNGVDFWWDEFLGNDGNCWYDNEGPDGTPGSVTSESPDTGGTPPNILPSNCEASAGNLDASKEAILLDCSMWSRGNTGDDHDLCYWFDMPAQPGSRRAAEQQEKWGAAHQRYIRSDEHDALEAHIREAVGEPAP